MPTPVGNFTGRQIRRSRDIRSRNLPKMDLLFPWLKKKKLRVAKIRSRNLPKMGPWSKKKNRRVAEIRSRNLPRMGVPFPTFARPFGVELSRNLSEQICASKLEISLGTFQVR